MGNSNSSQMNRSKSTYSFPRYKWRPLRISHGNKLIGHHTQSEGQLVMTIDLTKGYGNRRRELRHISLTTDCVFAPYDDSRLITCISIHGLHFNPGRGRFSSILMDDVINVWNLSGHKRGECGGPVVHEQRALLTFRKKNSLSVPASIRPSHDARFLCFPDNNHLEFRNMRNLNYVFVRDALFRRSNCYKSIAISPDDSRAAGIISVNGDAYLFICSTDLFYLYWTRSCIKLFPRLAELGPLRDNTDMACAYSPSGSFLAVTTSTGAMFLVNKLSLQTGAGVLPRQKKGSDERLTLAGAKAFDFHPLFSSGVIALCTKDNTLRIYDVKQEDFVAETKLPEKLGATVAVKYNSMGKLLAISGNNAHIAVYKESDFTICTVLNTSIPCPRCAIRIPQYNPRNNRTHPTVFLSLSFSHDSMHLSASSSDGLVRIWRLPVILSLKQQCRLAILKATPISKVGRLPVPEKLRRYIVCKPY